MISLLVTLLVIVVVCGVLWGILGLLPFDPRIVQAGRLIVALIALVWVLQAGRLIVALIALVWVLQAVGLWGESGWRVHLPR